MAKTKERDWVREVEEAARKAVSAIPGFNKLSELEWCNAVHEGLGTYLDGIEMRMDELKAAEDGEV